MLQVHEEIMQFITSGPSLEQILEYRPSEPMRDRIQYLINSSRSGELTPQERRELDEYTRIEYFMSKLKKRARRRLAVN